MTTIFSRSLLWPFAAVVRLVWATDGAQTDAAKQTRMSGFPHVFSKALS
jgi:hypothetical protein